jgi:hypothetical protein
MKTRRMHSLFQVVVENGRKRYLSASDLQFDLATARRVFQGALLSSALGGKQVFELRPVVNQKMRNQ